MPEMDGYEATSEIRRREKGESNRPVIIAVTANVLEGEYEKCLAVGMDDYVGKPVKIKTLRQKLERWVASSDEQVNTATEMSNIFSQEDEHEVIDLSVLAGFREIQQPGTPDLVDKLIDLFIEDTTKRLSALKKAAVDKDVNTIKKQAHNLKGSSSFIGAVQVTTLSTELAENALDITQMEGLITELEAEFEKVLQFFSAMRQSNK